MCLWLSPGCSWVPTTVQVKPKVQVTLGVNIIVHCLCVSPNTHDIINRDDFRVDTCLITYLEVRLTLELCPWWRFLTRAAAGGKLWGWEQLGAAAGKDTTLDLGTFPTNQKQQISGHSLYRCHDILYHCVIYNWIVIYFKQHMASIQFISVYICNM